MSLPKTTKSELIAACEKLTNYDEMTDLKKAVERLKKADSIIKPEDHHKVVEFIVAAAQTYPQIETDPNNKDLLALCERTVSDSPEPEVTRTPSQRR